MLSIYATGMTEKVEQLFRQQPEGEPFEAKESMAAHNLEVGDRIHRGGGEYDEIIKLDTSTPDRFVAETRRFTADGEYLDPGDWVTEAEFLADQNNMSSIERVALTDEDRDGLTLEQNKRQATQLPRLAEAIAAIPLNGTDQERETRWKLEQKRAEMIWQLRGKPNGPLL